MPETPSLLKQWTDFYVIVGSSAGALTGLQFVVIALIAEGEHTATMTQIRAFGTPTIVHFCVVLLISAITTAPWHEPSNAAMCLAICGVGGVAYVIRVISHTRRQSGYAPDTTDGKATGSGTRRFRSVCMQPYLWAVYFFSGVLSPDCSLCPPAQSRFCST